MVETTRLKGLKGLDLHGCQIGVEGLSTLLRTRYFGDLVYLDLSSQYVAGNHTTQLGREGAEWIAAADLYSLKYL